MEKRTEPLVSREMIYVCLGFVVLIIVLMVLGATKWGFLDMLRLWINGFKSLF